MPENLLIRIVCWSAAIALVVGCQSLRRGPELPEARSTQAHLDLAKWNRKPDCCEARGRQLAIAAEGVHAASSAVDTHAAGGSPVDAAIAAAFVLAVERPYSMGLGGGGFLSISLPAKGGKPAEAVFLDFRETAPHEAMRDMYLDRRGQIVPGKSENGALAVATPGFVAGMREAHRRWGKLPWKKLVAPAIRLAEGGFLVFPSFAERTGGMREKLSANAYMRKLFLKSDGSAYKAGERFRQPDLARTLRRISEDPDVFYRGELAGRIAEFIRAEGGILDRLDLDHYEVRVREPLRWEWGGYTFLGAPPPSAGGVVMAEVLQVIEPFSLALEGRYPQGYTHLLSQAFKHAYADRSTLVGDPDFVDMGFRKMLDRGHADTIRGRLDLKRNRPSAEIAPLVPVKQTPGTVHLSLLDSEGVAVAATLTINGPFGAGLAVPGTGIVLNNEMDDFSAKPGTGNVYGLTGSDANAIAANKRPVSSMSPTIVLQGGSPVLVTGGAGGSRIITETLQVVLNALVHFPGEPRRAVFAPRMHHQWLPDRLDLEAGLPPEVVAGLVESGHEIQSPPPWTARVQLVQRLPDGTLVAVHDPRDYGGAVAR